MSCQVVHTASIRVLILCLLTCVAYLVIFKIDSMCTRMLCCDVCVAVSWFIHVLMLWMSFVVAVPVKQLRASPRKGSKLLLQWMSFQWHSKFPSDMCAVIIKECLVGYACRTGWKMTDSPRSIRDGFMVGVRVSIMR